MGIPAKPKDLKKTVVRTLSYLSGDVWRLVLVGVCIVISSLAAICFTYFFQPIIDDYIVPFIGRKNVDLSGFASLILLMACIYVIGIASTYVYNRIMLKITHNALLRIRKDLFSHMQTLPLRYFDTNTNGDLMSRFTNDTDTMRQMISQSVPQLINSAITVIGVFAMMLYFSPLLTVLVVLMIFVVMAVVSAVGKKSGKYFREQQKSLGAVNGYIEEMIGGQKVVKVFTHEAYVTADFADLNEELRKAATNANTYAGIMGPITNNLGYIHYALTAILGSVMVVNGFTGLTVGRLASFLQCTRNFAMPINQISQQANVILMALAGAERIFDMMDEAAEYDHGKVRLVRVEENEKGVLCETEKRTGSWAWRRNDAEGNAEYIPLRGDVRLCDVTFGYVPEKTVLHNVNVYAKPGQKIAFVGSTGAGKTTITNLLNRFYDVEEGVITFDGIDLKDICKDDLRRCCGMVLQDTHLFTGTVRDNIRYGNLDASDEDVERAAKLANADFFITHLPQGYDTMLTADGANLSQGQRQLLSIARAAVSDPPVLILDEATSSIDTRTEKLIEKGMDTLMEGRTVFVIAHRLSTVRASNAIMVLENGVIIERGDHDDLIAQRGKYYQLYTGAFELD